MFYSKREGKWKAQKTCLVTPLSCIIAFPAGWRPPAPLPAAALVRVDTFYECTASRRAPIGPVRTLLDARTPTRQGRRFRYTRAPPWTGAYARAHVTRARIDQMRALGCGIGGKAWRRGRAWTAVFLFRRPSRFFPTKNRLAPHSTSASSTATALEDTLVDTPTMVRGERRRGGVAKGYQTATVFFTVRDRRDRKPTLPPPTSSLRRAPRRPRSPNRPPKSRARPPRGATKHAPCRGRARWPG